MTRIRFEDLPSTNTPRNAENLNKLNNVVISSTEPTTGEEVWFQKGKNLFNPNDVNYTKWLSEEGEPYTANEGDIVTSFIDVLPNTNYTISGLVVEQWLIVCGYDINKNFVSLLLPSTGSSGISWTINVPSNVAYIRCGFSGFNSSATVIQIEEGITATPYEPFTRKIYTKNDNGVYEEFYNETNREVYSLAEQRIGTWIDGMSLYRKVIKTTNVTVSYAGLNLYNIIDVKIMANINNTVLFNTGRYNNPQDLFTWYVNVENGTINIDVGSAWDFKEATIILEYTKTTD